MWVTLVRSWVTTEDTEAVPCDLCVAGAKTVEVVGGQFPRFTLRGPCGRHHLPPTDPACGRKYRKAKERARPKFVFVVTT